MVAAMSRDRVLKSLVNKIESIQLAHPIRVAIDGIDASGKTTLADELAVLLKAAGREVLRASSDSFHQPREIRYRKGEYSPDGYYYDSFDYEAILSLLLIPLGPGGNCICRIGTYDFHNNQSTDEAFIQVSKDTILLFDGVFLLRPELYSSWDYRIFINADFEISLIRALKRDISLFGSVEMIKQRYLQRYFPGQQIYLDKVNPGALANVIINNRQLDNPVIQTPPR